jgi:hypothetical protein
MMMHGLANPKFVALSNNTLRNKHPEIKENGSL